MKWLVIQSAGEHSGQDGWCRNDQMRECFAIQYALERFGDTADVWGLRHANYHKTPNFENYDGIFTIENYELDWLPDLSGYWRTLRIHWIIDAHWRPIEVFDSVLPRNDIILHSTRKFIAPYKDRHPKQSHFYFPNGVDDRFFDQLLYTFTPHNDDLIFIGGKATPRAEALDLLTDMCGMKYSYGITGMDYVRAVLNAKIQFNKGLNGDINYRNWETIGLGTCLLTEYDPEMELLGFEHDVNCLFYRNLDTAVKLAKDCLLNGEWQRIAAAGYVLSRQHTYVRRIDKLIHNLFTREQCQHNLWNLPTPTSAPISVPHRTL